MRARLRKMTLMAVVAVAWVSSPAARLSRRAVHSSVPGNSTSPGPHPQDRRR